MKNGKYQRPNDTPAAACGRCFWWKQTDNQGWGKCLVLNEKRWHQCMVCPEYEFEPRL